ncbi:type I restriction endonuclease subunit R [Macrococcus equipercicus]|uniref:Type I restriction enzyme endonuclease subunit n=1 Tax=Macrococcus equipercicus TaxID=69967 RepID=A0ABQ6R6I0_9STAP|nr:type I restriction endonuclease subunit R [Macrococcus equipercicus]KAA1036891.1 type I restriction endonuclease subunit R [Macrococcus equipercicus]
MYQSEHALEELTISQLVAKGYERIQIKDDEVLLDNFRQILNERHMDKLKNEPLTDAEFDRLMTQINGKSVFDSAMILRDKFVLTRDDESKVYLEFFNTEKWCQNKFQVTNQVTVHDTYKGRYDITILINGLPATQIELKRSGVAFSEAFNQVERYRRHNFTGLFRYIQLFVISNSVETRYYANSDKEINKSNMFYWSDEENNRINNLKEFAETFLEPCHLAKMIARYMVVNESDRILMAMRPYQVYAVEAIINRALETNNNGYIWHTTGSGKTLTSFKASQLLAKEPGISKVIFLVDRRDLDSQTLAEFNKFEKGAVDMTDNTHTLLKQLGDRSKSLIVTTIQKMAHAIKRQDPVMAQYETEKVVFIIDECHRTQFGEMHRLIKQQFKNAQYFGFTGTPRFEENKSQDGRATADIFEKCLHKYLIKDAIRDGNVLGFSVEYINTFKNEVDTTNEEYVESINTDEVWMADERIQMVAEHIYRNHHKKTRNGQYSAILATQKIPMAMKYYHALKALSEQEGKNGLKIATIFTYQPNQDMRDGEVTEHAKDQLESVIKDYNKTFGTNYSTDTYNSYFADISKRVKQGIKDNKIDILIVVNMFLTGFDSKVLNTLYVDKNLKHHDLIQAYSRTNRIEKETKPYGNIVAYRNLKKATDDAIQLFSTTDNTETVLSQSYDSYLKVFLKTLGELYTMAPDPSSVDQIEDEEQQKTFVETFKQLSKTLLMLKTFDEFEFDEAILEIDQQTYEEYKGKYLHLYEETKKRKEADKVSVLDDIDFEIEIMRNDIINVSYILNLLREINLEDKKEQNKMRQQIHDLLDKADDENLRLKRDLIRAFLDKVVPTLLPGSSIDDAFMDFEEEEKQKAIESFSKKFEYPQQQLNRLVSEYEFSGQLDRSEVGKPLAGGLLTKRKKIDEVQTFIKETSKIYSSEM